MNLLNKLREPSTWRGISILLTLLGVRMHPELIDAITTAGVAAVAGIEVLRKERQAQ